MLRTSISCAARGEAETVRALVKERRMNVEANNALSHTSALASLRFFKLTERARRRLGKVRSATRRGLFINLLNTKYKKMRVYQHNFDMAYFPQLVFAILVVTMTQHVCLLQANTAKVPYDTSARGSAASTSAPNSVTSARTASIRSHNEAMCRGGFDLYCLWYLHPLRAQEQHSSRRKPCARASYHTRPSRLPPRRTQQEHVWSQHSS